jgi:hypothetical protein
MADIRVLIVVDGVFNLSTTYPYQSANPNDSPDEWFTLSFLIAALSSPTFAVDTASRGFNGAGTFPNVTNDTPDPNATLKGPDPSNPIPFRFDDPSVNLLDYDVIWLFSDEGYDGGVQAGPVSGTTEPGRLSDSELAKITEFMQAGGGLFAVGDHDGLGAGMCGFIPRVRSMRKWFDAMDGSSGLPPSAATRNWPSSGATRRDTLQKGSTDDDNNPNATGDPVFFFDDQSDDRAQPLTVLVPSHPVVQGATGVLTVYPDHMHEGEVMAPAGAQLAWNSATDSTLSFAGPNFTEFPSTTVGNYREAPIILAQAIAGQTPHGTTVTPEDMVCATPFGPALDTCVKVPLDVLAAYDGHRVNVGRIVTDSSFHHFIDLNLLGDPCSNTANTDKRAGFNFSASGQVVLKELKAFYVNIATWLAWIDRKLYFGLGKNNYGRDEVSDHLSPYVYQDAFYVFLEGFTPNVVGFSTPLLSGTFNNTNIPGLLISTTPTITYDIGDTGANANVPQRIRFAYSIQFISESLNVFPGSGNSPQVFTLNASINIGDNPYQSPPVEFFLLGGANPYFTNVNASADNRFYLSQDLRVLTITPTANNQTPIVANPSPVSPVPFVFQNGNPATQDTTAAYTYIQGLITYLNKTYGYLNSSYAPPDTNTFDPLDTLLPDQNGALNGDSSVTPQAGSFINYNFAIARVRLQGPSGQAIAAPNVKVFFRMFTTQTFDTDFINTTTATTIADPYVTYPPGGSNPSSPLPGTDSANQINGCSLPFFATANLNQGPTDYDSPPAANNQNIEIPNGDYAWAFFGCFLNVNDATNQFGDPSSQYGEQPVQYWLAGSAHNCLVAQIAYEFSPIENVNGVIENPENSDKLAQRNLQVTTSGNPGFPATHRVPQTIDVRPSPPPQSTDKRSILSYPDEIMIDWGDTPRGSVARIYWPEASAASVVELAKQLYPVNTVSAADANTIQCEVASPVTYIPIPFGAGGSFAGLLTIDLPASVRDGNEFNVLVRRITTKQILARKDEANTPERASVSVAAAIRGAQSVWRYVSGSFLARISVQRESEILPADENLLAILKWRLGLIGPSNRWYPILLRYIGYLSGRINGMGGNASGILPSPNGYQPPSPPPGSPGKPTGEHQYTGKVIGIRYDRFGDFEGFTILSKNGQEHRFRGREPQVHELLRRAWIERTLISVFVESHDPDWPASIVLERWK